MARVAAGLGLGTAQPAILASRGTWGQLDLVAGRSPESGPRFSQPAAPLGPVQVAGEERLLVIAAHPSGCAANRPPSRQLSGRPAPRSPSTLSVVWPGVGLASP